MARIKALAFILLLSSMAHANPVTQTPGTNETSVSNATTISSPSTLNATSFDSSNMTEYASSNFTSINWDLIIPAFEGIKNSSEALNNRPDHDVFAFTQENLKESGVHIWYAAWTRKAQLDPLWKKRGEARLFALLFLDQPDYDCVIDLTWCLNVPLRDNIIKLWPGPENRALAQRIYLQLQMFSNNHNAQKAELEALSVAEAYITGHSYDIVKTFTKQIDSKSKSLCDTIHKIVDLSVQIAVSLASGAGSALSSALTAKGSLLESFGSVNFGTGKVLNEAADDLDNAALTMVNGKLVQNAPKAQDAPNWDWFGIFQRELWSVGANAIKDGSRSKAEVRQGNVTVDEEIHLNHGIGGDGMCSSFGGDRQDLNDENSEKFRGIISDTFAKLRVNIQNMHSNMVRGWAPEPNMPSMMAINFAFRDWFDESQAHVSGGTVTAASREGKLLLTLLKSFFGRIISDDNNFLKCLHVADAQEQCNMDSTKQKHDYLKDYRATMICPRPETDPTLLCSAARFYHTVNGQSHIESMAGIHSIGGWKNGTFGFDIKELLLEAYDFYELYRNDPNKVDLTSAGKSDGPYFYMPTCVNDALRLHDMNPFHYSYLKPNPSHLEFPFRCGQEWRADETPGFMKLMNLDPGSQMYNSIEGLSGTRHPNFVFWDIIPRLIDRRSSTAVTSFINLCANAIRLPQTTEPKGNSWVINKYRPQIGRDQDCSLVEEATRNMTENDANRWFCNNEGNHTIFERQRHFYTLPQTLWEKPAHEKQCEKWKAGLKKAEDKQRKVEEKKLSAEEKKELEEEKQELKELEKVWEQEQKELDEEELKTMSEEEKVWLDKEKQRVEDEKKNWAKQQQEFKNAAED